MPQPPTTIADKAMLMGMLFAVKVLPVCFLRAWKTTWSALTLGKRARPGTGNEAVRGWARGPAAGEARWGKERSESLLALAQRVGEGTSRAVHVHTVAGARRKRAGRATEGSNGWMIGIAATAGVVSAHVLLGPCVRVTEKGDAVSDDADRGGALARALRAAFGVGGAPQA